MWINEAQVRAELSFVDAVSTVESALKEFGDGNVENQVRRRVHLGSTALNMMSASIPQLGVMGAKVYTTGEKGPNAYFLLFDASGDLLCTMEADELGRIRTGAVTALATKYLARADAFDMALLGTGFQAETQLLAICATRSMRKVKVWSRNFENASAFCKRLEKEVQIELEPVGNVKNAISGVGIITASTSSPEPILWGDWLERGVHINAIGNNRSYEREIDSVVVSKANQIVVDSIEHAQAESGDLLLAEQDGVTVWSRTLVLSDILVDHSPVRKSEEDITLFKSNGLALEDVAVAHHVYSRVINRNGLK